MARDNSPIVKQSRREGYALHPKAHKVLARKSGIPGQHAHGRQNKPSLYATQLREKQKVRRLYGLVEKQFARLMNEATRAQEGLAGENLLKLLERRLDNVVYRSGFAVSRRAARQLVSHGHFELNGRRVDIPSIRVKAGDVITVRPKSTKSEYFTHIDDVINNSIQGPLSWLKSDSKKLKIEVTGLPKREEALASVDDISATSATFLIEPLHPGYGNTLGNSLRRVLLSSVRGGAIVAFKIEGATHEFTTVEGIKEDVVDIMLNLKNVHLRVFTDEPVELRLEKSGAGEVTAADIKTNADVEVVNPEQVIATIDDPNKHLVMDLVVEAGCGYQTIEESSENRLHSDMIAIDAMYSPVLRVRYKVDSTRVGQETNLDKLAITVETNGTVTPREAFEEAAAILVNQYTALAGNTMVTGAPALGTTKDDEESELAMSIEELNLSARTTNALINNEIRTIRDLVTLTEQDLRELKGFGSKALDEVRDKMAELEF